jgi:hypothetical protein
VTAAKTRLARMYHATSILTAKGDIIVVSTCLTVLPLVDMSSWAHTSNTMPHRHVSSYQGRGQSVWNGAWFHFVAGELEFGCCKFL